MTILKLKISGIDLDNIVNFLIQELNFDYENHSKDMSILYAEHFYFTNLDTHSNMIVLKIESSVIRVDILAGIGATNLLNIGKRVEREYTEEIGELLHRYAKENSLQFEFV